MLIPTLAMILMQFVTLSNCGDCRGQQPVFVAGCGHSGTSVMLRLIGEHPRIFMFGNETCALCRVGYGLTEEEETQGEWERNARRLHKLDDTFESERSPEEIRFVEKTPLHVRYLEKLFLLRPNALAVLLVRDGRDVAASFKGRRRSQFHTDAVISGANRWVRDTTQVLAFKNHKNVLVVRYEALVKNTSSELNRLFRFLSEEYDEQQILSYYTKPQAFNGVIGETRQGIDIAETDHEHLRANQFNQPLYDGSGRYKLEPPKGLSDEDWNTLKKVKGFFELLDKLNYVD
eukprot:m.149985 g.149985  ORF g.149985 m.149985 type:complete len:289 (-) comp30699_c0_seq2:199-1065(-)